MGHLVSFGSAVRLREALLGTSGFDLIDGGIDALFLCRLLLATRGKPAEDLSALRHFGSGPEYLMELDVVTISHQPTTAVLKPIEEIVTVKVNADTKPESDI